MEIILLERVNQLGAMGEFVTVKDGYARNFLIPQGKALRATKENKEQFEARRKEIEADNAKTRAAAEKRIPEFKDLAVALIRPASEEGKLYGSITIRDIADALAADGHDINRSQVVLDQPIKHLGEYTVTLQLHPEVEIPVTLRVVRNESDATASNEAAPDTAEDAKTDDAAA